MVREYLKEEEEGGGGGGGGGYESANTMTNTSKT
jgi:hypothetical protein